MQARVDRAVVTAISLIPASGTSGFSAEHEEDCAMVFPSGVPVSRAARRVMVISVVSNDGRDSIYSKGFAIRSHTLPSNESGIMTVESFIGDVLLLLSLSQLLLFLLRCHQLLHLLFSQNLHNIMTRDLG
jgi:hypothetical protein